MFTSLIVIVIVIVIVMSFPIWVGFHSSHMSTRFLFNFCSHFREKFVWKQTLFYKGNNIWIVKFILSHRPSAIFFVDRMRIFKQMKRKLKIINFQTKRSLTKRARVKILGIETLCTRKLPQMMKWWSFDYRG